MTAILLGIAAVAATVAGGAFALRFHDRLHLILGFSAGTVLGVALFDLLPESFDLAPPAHGAELLTALIAAGFFAYMLMNRAVEMHPDGARRGWLGATALTLHSFLDGVGIGLAFQASTTVGVIVATAVLAHDFSDGINTVNVILARGGARRDAFRWLVMDALAPLAGVLVTFTFSLSDASLGVVLAIFCGFFLYIGAGDLLPESHHRHPKRLTSVTNVLGAAMIWLAIHLAG